LEQQADNLDPFLEAIEAILQRQEVKSKHLVFAFLPAGSQPEDQSPLR
jgi:hypothetical protein